ncbi:MAG: RodZ domain-containing protein [Woeseia sp.]
MTEEMTKPTEGENASPGARLAEARRARAISLSEIARELHLDEPKVSALEQNAFESLGAPVFTKGYLRKYAELVGIPVDEILADYYRLNRSTSAPPIVGNRERPARDVAPGPWLGATLVVLLAAGAAWWWSSGGAGWLERGTVPATLLPSTSDEEVNQPPRRVEPAAGQEPSSAAEPAASDAEPASDVASSPDLPVEEPAQAEPRSGTQPRAEAGAAVELAMTFSGDCWTEVTDASGERLFFGLGSAGRTVTVRGNPPLQVLLGDSDNAALTVNGERYGVPSSARRGDTARLTITGR